MVLPRTGQSTGEALGWRLGSCPLTYGWMRVGIQDKQFTAQQMWDTETWDYSMDRDCQKGMVLSGS